MSDAPSLDLDPEDDFPWEDVVASRNRKSLQRRHDEEKARAEYSAATPSCPACNRAASELSWFYFESPRWTWDALCGRAGWMVVCDDCRKQVAFFLEIMN